jgi:peptide/nickel transport system substrate-binding protein
MNEANDGKRDGSSVDRATNVGDGMPNAGRRSALRTMAAGVSALMLPAGGLYAAQSTMPASATPKQGGRLVAVAQALSTSDTLDPARASYSSDYMRQAMFYSGLTQFDGKLNAQPALAETITSDDGKTWNVTLRKGVTFHDGKALSPDDVVYSLMRHKLPETASKAKSIADQISDVQQTGPNAVRITLTAPNVDLPMILAGPQFLIVQNGTKDFTKGIGTGPYRLDTFAPGVRTIGKRFENFWKPGKPYLDQVELIGINDASARTNALLSGDVQLISMLSPNAVDMVKSAGHGVLETRSGLYTNLIMRQDVAPTNNPDFVLAIKYLLNREWMVKAALNGYGMVANDTPVPPFHRYFLKDLPQRQFDPEKAKFHLKKAGLAGTSITLVGEQELPGAMPLAQSMLAPAAAAGLKINLNRVPVDGYWSNHWMKDPFGFAANNPRPTLDLAFTQLYQSSAAWNESGWKDEKFDQLLLAARSETDDVKRKQMYGDMQVIVHDKCGVAIPAFISYLDGYRSNVRGLEAIPTGTLMGYQFAEHVWLA